MNMYLCFFSFFLLCLKSINLSLSVHRERVLEDGQVADNGSQEQRSCPIRVTFKIPLDPTLNSHGFTVSTHTPPQVLDVTEGTLHTQSSLKHLSAQMGSTLIKNDVGTIFTPKL